MQVISLCSQKGGSGKTTLTGHLAVQAARQGDGPVALIDCDPQGSLAAWWNSRESPQPAFLRDLARDPRQRPAAPARARLSLRVHRHAAGRQHADPAGHGAERSGRDPDPAQPARSAGGPRDARPRRAGRQAADLRRQRRRATRPHHLRRGRGPVAARHRGAQLHLPPDRPGQLDDRRPHGDGGRPRAPRRRPRSWPCGPIWRIACCGWRTAWPSIASGRPRAPSAGAATRRPIYRHRTWRKRPLT